jgi:hypothetical protein
MGLSLAQRIDPSRAILLVIDMQNDFCHRDGAACKRGRDMAFVQNMIPRLITLLNRARVQGLPICFVRTSGNPWTNSPVWTEFKNPELLACADGTWGAEFHQGLAPQPGGNGRDQTPLQRVHRHGLGHATARSRHKQPAGHRRRHRHVCFSHAHRRVHAGLLYHPGGRLLRDHLRTGRSQPSSCIG